MEVSTLVLSAQHVRNMFNLSVNGTDNARPKDFKKNGNFHNDFYPRMKFFSKYRKKFFV